jgi:arylformamidase
VTAIAHTRVAQLSPLSTSVGFLFLPVDYGVTLGKVPPGHMEDVPKRIVWVMEHIGEYGGDPSQLSIMGYLAGAHIVALVATDRRHLVEHDAELSRLSDVIIHDDDVCSPDNLDRGSGLDP